MIFNQKQRDLIEFIMHRLREAFGEQAGHAKGKRRGHRNAVLTPVERGGKSRTKASSRSVLGVNDFERAEIAAAGIKGKRLTYRRADSIPKAEAH